MNSTSHVGNTRLLRPVVVAVEYQEDSQAENDQAKNEEEPEEPPMSQGQVIDIMTFNSYGLQYYSFRKGKIGFARTVPVSWTMPIHTKRYNITI